MQMEHGSGNSGRKPSWLTGRGILIAVIFLLGLGIFLYPHICDWYYQYQFNKAIAAYDRFQGIDCEGMIQAAREYNERLAKKEEQFLVPAEEREELDHLLDPWETGMMGYVDIPKIGVHVPMLWSSFFVTLVAKKIVLINLCCRPCFIWGSITIITVWTNMIIINVCKFFYLLIECFLCCKLIQICAFILQGIEITLHRCIVVRISCFAHALCHIYRFAEFGKCFGRIL